jgi:hydroxylamine reductase
MFCYQCEETTKETACTVKGVCGKSADVAALEDLLIELVKKISSPAHSLTESGYIDEKVNSFVLKALFTTVTNVNFNESSLQDYLFEAQAVLNQLKLECKNRQIDYQNTADLPNSLEDLISLANETSIEFRIEQNGEDITSLQEMLIYGIKGMAAYAHHAEMLGYIDNDVSNYIYKAMSYIALPIQNSEKLIDLNMECGAHTVTVMALLDKAHTDTYGHPVPTAVHKGGLQGKAILVSGHDLKVLEELLIQTENSGINIYTHSEMLPAHGYPELKKYKHLAGNYGSAWHNQKEEFKAFPGPIVMTSNCIQKPSKKYIDRIYTCGPVSWPEVKHIDGYDFSEVKAKALSCDGYLQDETNGELTVGFAHNAVLGVADKIVDAVKSGAIKHFFLVGGCDGHKSSRQYYTDFTTETPDDSVILTLGCAKFRFNDIEHGSIGGIPRLLDLGQCNDAFSAVKIATALANAFDCSINDLPLTLNISWYEQKAVCILLALLHLGIKNIKLGPTLPAFISPGVLDFLVENFNISGISDAKQDLEEALA